MRVKLASSKENATNVKNRIENEHKTKKNDFDHKNNLLKLEVKMLKESVIEKKATITQLNEKVKLHDSLMARTALQNVQTEGAKQRQELK